MYEIYLHQEVEAGIEEARRGEFASDDDVKAAFARVYRLKLKWTKRGLLQLIKAQDSIAQDKPVAANYASSTVNKTGLTTNFKLLN